MRRDPENGGFLGDTSVAGSDSPVAHEASIEWIREFVGRWLEAWNAHQADHLLEFLTEDVEVRDDS